MLSFNEGKVIEGWMVEKRIVGEGLTCLYIGPAADEVIGYDWNRKYALGLSTAMTDHLQDERSDIYIIDLRMLGEGPDNGELEGSLAMALRSTFWSGSKRRWLFFICEDRAGIPARLFEVKRRLDFETLSTYVILEDGSVYEEDFRQLIDADIKSALVVFDDYLLPKESSIKFLSSKRKAGSKGSGARKDNEPEEEPPFQEVKSKHPPRE